MPSPGGFRDFYVGRSGHRQHQVFREARVHGGHVSARARTCPHRRPRFPDLLGLASPTGPADATLEPFDEPVVDDDLFVSASVDVFLGDDPQDVLGQRPRESAVLVNEVRGRRWRLVAVQVGDPNVTVFVLVPDQGQVTAEVETNFPPIWRKDLGQEESTNDAPSCAMHVRSLPQEQYPVGYRKQRNALGSNQFSVREGRSRQPVEWTLTLDEYVTLVTGECNCVSCCAPCNREKRVQSQRVFIENTRRRYEHLRSRGLITT